MTVSVPGCFYGTGMVGLPDAPSFLALAKGADGTDGSRPSASTSDLIAGRALDANGRYVNDVLDNPDLMAPFQPEPVGRLGGVFVFGDHHQLTGLLDVVSDLLGAAEARPLPQELHFHKNQYRVGSDFNHGVPPFLLNRRPLRKIRRRGGPANAARGQGPQQVVSLVLLSFR